jgi:hypothetical protein
MNMKNTAILLIFLLCVLGLMMGVYYTESSEPSINTADYEEIIHEDSNGTITIHLEKKNNEKNFMNKLIS